MFQIEEAVLYDMWGVCIIETVEHRRSAEGMQDYLVLRPVYHYTAKLYLPNREETLKKCLRPVIGREEICELLGTLGSDALAWIEEPGERAELCRRILASGDRKRILELIAMLYRRKLELRGDPKSLQFRWAEHSSQLYKYLLQDRESYLQRQGYMLRNEVNRSLASSMLLHHPNSYSCS